MAWVFWSLGSAAFSWRARFFPSLGQRSRSCSFCSSYRSRSGSAFLLLYYVNSLMIALLRRLGLYSAMTNNPFQHFVIMSLTTLLALLLVRDESGWMRSLGIFWLGLLFLNLISILLLQIPA